MSRLRSPRSSASFGRPALADGCSAARSRSDERDMVLGDLQEQLPRAARRWYWRQAIAIAAHAIAAAHTDRGEPRPVGRLLHAHLPQRREVRVALAVQAAPADGSPWRCTLALGLGANAAIFNLIDRLVLRPFPRVDPDNVVMIAETGPRLSYRRETTSPANFLDWRASADSVTHMTAMRVVGRQPGGPRGSRAAAGRAGVVRILRRARHPPRARPRLRARRRDLRPPSRRRAERRPVEAPLRRRSRRRRQEHHHQRRAAPGHRRRAATIRVPGRRGTVGADRVRSEAGAAARQPISDRHRPRPGGQDVRGRRRRRWLCSPARLARDYPDANRDHGVRVYTLDAGDAGRRIGTDAVACGRRPRSSSCSSPAPTSPT